MDKKQKIEYWLDISDYDLETAESMFKSGRYLYVAFMCQQAIEKIIKALYISCLDEDPPRTHNLSFIFKKLEIKAPDDTLNFFNILTAHYIENRYPEYKNKLSELMNKEKAENLLIKTREIYRWLKFLII